MTTNKQLIFAIRAVCVLSVLAAAIVLVWTGMNEAQRPVTLLALLILGLVLGDWARTWMRG